MKTIIIIIVIITSGIINLIDGYNDKYESFEAVTYFDKDGRYQLAHLGNYTFYDAKEKRNISTSIIQYYVIGNKLYAICGDPAQEPDTYFYYVYEMFYDTKIESFSLNDFPKEDRDIFENEKFVDLTQNHTGLEKHFQKIIPYKWRKW